MTIKSRLSFVLITGLFSNVANAATNFSFLGADVSFSGFATVGFAISNQSYRYQRFIDSDGTFKRDSLVGGQLDIKFNNEFSITTQAKLAAAVDNDEDITPDMTWAFISWRPANDWLFRLGRLRGPLYLNSANTDIGATFDFARLPTEIYSTIVSPDMDGILIEKAWSFDEDELTLNGYVGRNHSHFRKAAYRFGEISAPAEFFPTTMNAYGVSLTYQHEENLFRLSAHDTYTSCSDCYKGNYFRVTFPYINIAPNIGYYKVSNQMPGADLPEAEVLHTPVYSAAVDISLGEGFRFMGEYVRRNVRNIDTGIDTQGGYIALLKSFDKWTPYISVARLESMDKTMNLYNKVKNNVIPSMIPGSEMLNATQQAGAASIPVYDQTTWAIGTSYNLDLNSKLKAEWAITDTGSVSSFVDAPANEVSGNRLINVFSFSYNIVF